MPPTQQLEIAASTGHSRPPILSGDASRPHVALLTEAFPPHAGGSRIYYYNLYKRLALHFGYSVVIVTSEAPGSKEFDACETTGQLRIVRRSAALPSAKYNQFPRMVLRIVREWRWACSPSIDLLQVGDLFPQGITALLANRVSGMPYMIFAHGEEITQTDRFRHQPRLRDMIYTHAHTVIAANPFARENLLRIGVNAAKIVTICPGVDAERFAPRPARPDLVERYQLQGKTVILSVGRLVPHKGHSVLLAALAALVDTVPSAHYLIAGQGPEEANLRSQVQALGLGSRVTFLGSVPDEELADIYNLCDVFALANREMQGEQEGFGMVFLEASAAGKPVLAGRTGGTSAAVVHGKTGLLFDPENPADAVASLSLLLTRQDMREHLGCAGRDWVASTFCWDRSAAQLHAILSSLMASRQAVPGVAQPGVHSASSPAWSGGTETL